MITGKITIEELEFDEDIAEGCGKHNLKDGEAEPLICEMRKDGTTVLVDGYHRLSGLIAEGETEVTIGIIEDSDFENYHEIWDGEGDEFECMVDYYSNK